MEEKILQLFKVHQREAINLNTDQLYSGKDSTGKSLPEYSDRSVNVFGKRPGPWQLFNEGNFYRGFFVRIEGGKVIFDSSDSKTGLIFQMLEGKGHPEPMNIFGLTKPNQKEISRETILPDLQNFLLTTIRKG